MVEERYSGTNSDDSEVDKSSAGHAIGQKVGDWWEQKVILPLLSVVATKLDLFLDNRSLSRACRGDRVTWEDADGNSVDYDFVLELGGTTDKRGIPVGFIESFWRRGARHSRDKARDDTNKLLPMRDTYPTARFLSIAASGEFTEPARDYVRTRLVDLFYVPKAHIIEAFQKCGLQIDYPDKLPEHEKAKLLNALTKQLSDEVAATVAKQLEAVAGQAVFAGFQSRVESCLRSLPQELRFIESRHSKPAVFTNVEEASRFLEHPTFNYEEVGETYSYEITYSDGFEFRRQDLDAKRLRELHHELMALVQHMERISRKP